MVESLKNDELKSILKAGIYYPEDLRKITSFRPRFEGDAS
jgi:hypothetical protein